MIQHLNTGKNVFFFRILELHQDELQIFCMIFTWRGILLNSHILYLYSDDAGWTNWVQLKVGMKNMTKQRIPCYFHSTGENCESIASWNTECNIMAFFWSPAWWLSDKIFKDKFVGFFNFWKINRIIFGQLDFESS